MFKVFFGSQRCVIVFPSFGFVFKFPSFHKARWVWYYFGKKPALYVLQTFLSQAWYFAIHGIKQNYRERDFWKKTKNPFLVPTYFSFFGLINIQEYKIVTSDSKLESLLLKEMSALWRSGVGNGIFDGVETHAWSSISNFTVTPSGHLQMLDYGGENDGQVILGCSAQLQAIILKA